MARSPLLAYEKNLPKSIVRRVISDRDANLRKQRMRIGVLSHTYMGNNSKILHEGQPESLVDKESTLARDVDTLANSLNEN